MAYTKQVWVDRNVSTPLNYVATKGGGGALSSGDTLTMTASAGTITAAGTPITASNMNHMEDAIESLNNGDALYVVTTGSANTYVATFSPVFTTYTTGLTSRVKFNASNTGASTINFDILGAKTIKKISNLGLVDLVEGDIIANGEYLIIYDGTYVVLHNPVPQTILYTPSDTVRLTANTERSTTNATFTSVKQFTVGKYGSVRFKFEIKNSSGTLMNIEIYNLTTTTVLGSTSTSSSTYVATLINTTAHLIRPGDDLQVRIKIDSSGEAFVQNVTLCADENIVIDVVDTD